MKNEVLMPRIGANDNYVTLCRWNVKEGEKVAKGQVIAQIETTKESSEIEAETDGYIHMLVLNNQSVAVGDVICQISDVYDAIVTESQEKEGDQEQTISAKARKLMEEYHIESEVFKGLNIVREKDVLSYLEQKKDETLKTEAVENDLSRKIIVNGSKGLSKMLIDAVRQRGEYEVVGLLDRRYPEGDTVRDIKVISKNDEESLKKLYDKGYRFMLNAIVFDRHKHDRKEPFLLMKKCGFTIPNIIHNTAIIEPGVRMGEGNFIAVGAIIGSDVQIGDNCVINAGAIVSHDDVIGSHTHIASGAILAGHVEIGENTLIGQGSTIYKDIKIGKNVVISNGVHVFEDVPDGAFLK